MDSASAFERWVCEIAEKTPAFVLRLRSNGEEGRFRLSVSGDVFPPNGSCGLAQTTFAIRVLYILNRLERRDADSMRGFIQRFRMQDGSYYDDYVNRKTRWRRAAQTLSTFDYRHLSGFYVRNAETRQAIAALKNSGENILSPYYPFIPEAKAITDFIRALDWRNPWGAASHVNHLIFFTKFCERLSPQTKDSIYEVVEQCLNQYRRADGFLYASASSPLPAQKIGGMMKTLMGLSLIGREKFWLSEGIIDGCLLAKRTGDACENLNTIFVLDRCLCLGHRTAEITDFALTKAESWRTLHYWPAEGGFSFYAGRAQDHYYGARVTKGLPEPDLHGTAMFIWGLYIVANMLGMKQKFNLKEAVL